MLRSKHGLGETMLREVPETTGASGCIAAVAKFVLLSALTLVWIFPLGPFLALPIFARATAVYMGAVTLSAIVEIPIDAPARSFDRSVTYWFRVFGAIWRNFSSVESSDDQPESLEEWGRLALIWAGSLALLALQVVVFWGAVWFALLEFNVLQYWGIYEPRRAYYY